MINPKELRIGNLLNWEAEHLNAGISKVISIDRDHFGIMSSAAWTRSDDRDRTISPIPLTPEWLIRCGFTLNSNEGYFTYDLPNKPQGIDSIKVGNGVYLHQLQNLFFALTGEELTIKDKVNHG